MKPDMPYGMTSREAAALYLSEGLTTDAELANQIDAAKHEPRLLIPRGTIPEKDYQPPAITLQDADDTERMRLREVLGFDATVTINEVNMMATLKDKALKLKTKAKLTGDPDIDGAAMSQAMIRLKNKHDKVVQRD